MLNIFETAMLIMLSSGGCSNVKIMPKKNRNSHNDD